MMMKTTEERKAEIFRRSNLKIQARKQCHRRISALCIPLSLCLILALGIIVMFPPGGARENPKNSAAENLPQSGGSADDTVVSVTVSFDEALGRGSYTITDVAQVEAIQGAVFDLYNDVQYSEVTGNPDAESDQAEGGDENSAINSNASVSYRITFYTADGGEERYELKNGALYDLNNNRTVFLPDSVLQELFEKLERKE